MKIKSFDLFLTQMFKIIFISFIVALTSNVFAQDHYDYLKMAQYHFNEKHQFDSCIHYAKLVLAQDLQNATAWYMIAVSKSNTGETADALPYVQEAIKLNDTKCEFYDTRGFIYDDLEKFDSAIHDFNRAISMCPEFGNAYFHKGSCYASQKKYKQALPEYDKAIKLDPEYHLAYYNRAMAYRRTGNNAKAMEDYTKCISLNPEYAAAYVNRSNVFDDQFKYKEALADLMMADKLEPNDPTCLNNMYLIYSKQKEWVDALKCLDRILAIDSNSEDVFYARAITLTRLFRYEEALVDIDKEIQKAPHDVQYLNKKAFILTEKKDLLEAIKVYTQSINISPGAYAYYHRGRLYFIRGSKILAAKDYEKAVKLDKYFKLPNLKYKNN